jgi:hypothetical protein
MGGTSPRQLRAEIEKTKEQLSEDLDRLAERVSPRRMAAADGGPKAAGGLVTFGAGLLAASAIPESPGEQRAAARLVGRAGSYADGRHAGAAGRAGDAIRGMRGARGLRRMRGLRGMLGERGMLRMRGTRGMGAMRAMRGVRGTRGRRGMPGMMARSMPGVAVLRGLLGLRRPSRLRRLRRNAQQLARHAADRAGCRRRTRMGGLGG